MRQVSRIALSSFNSRSDSSSAFDFQAPLLISSLIENMINCTSKGGSRGNE